jgi:hypothetical protein
MDLQNNCICKVLCALKQLRFWQQIIEDSTDHGVCFSFYTIVLLMLPYYVPYFDCLMPTSMPDVDVFFSGKKIPMSSSPLAARWACARGGRVPHLHASLNSCVVSCIQYNVCEFVFSVHPVLVALDVSA